MSVKKHLERTLQDVNDTLEVLCRNGLFDDERVVKLKSVAYDADACLKVYEGCENFEEKAERAKAELAEIRSLEISVRDCLNNSLDSDSGKALQSVQKRIIEWENKYCVDGKSVVDRVASSDFLDHKACVESDLAGFVDLLKVENSLLYSFVENCKSLESERKSKHDVVYAGLNSAVIDVRRKLDGLVGVNKDVVLDELSEAERALKGLSGAREVLDVDYDLKRVEVLTEKFNGYLRGVYADNSWCSKFVKFVNKALVVRTAVALVSSCGVFGGVYSCDVKDYFERLSGVIESKDVSPVIDSFEKSIKNNQTSPRSALNNAEENYSQQPIEKMSVLVRDCSSETSDDYSEEFEEDVVRELNYVIRVDAAIQVVASESNVLSSPDLSGSSNISLEARLGECLSFVDKGCELVYQSESHDEEEVIGVDASKGVEVPCKEEFIEEEARVWLSEAEKRGHKKIAAVLPDCYDAQPKPVDLPVENSDKDIKGDDINLSLLDAVIFAGGTVGNDFKNGQLGLYLRGNLLDGQSVHPTLRLFGSRELLDNGLSTNGLGVKFGLGLDSFFVDGIPLFYLEPFVGTNQMTTHGELVSAPDASIDRKLVARSSVYGLNVGLRVPGVAFADLTVQAGNGKYNLEEKLNGVLLTGKWFDDNFVVEREEHNPEFKKSGDLKSFLVNGSLSQKLFGVGKKDLRAGSYDLADSKWLDRAFNYGFSGDPFSLFGGYSKERIGVYSASSGFFRRVEHDGLFSYDVLSLQTGVVCVFDLRNYYVNGYSTFLNGQVENGAGIVLGLMPYVRSVKEKIIGKETFKQDFFDVGLRFGLEYSAGMNSPPIGFVVDYVNRSGDDTDELFSAGVSVSY
ncbi:hypothetical protein COV18_03485 [Candidatus Woesearchaeota archaeon CG10_big_fil_rev_8_21_14_0_10_37_12]|nr:MAG: hypothetical protein COV18_03485 [Candidatus Woesearchaeota archaeon CG10_big_fil_rev_8_21_14_0_10_37_12]